MIFCQIDKPLVDIIKKYADGRIIVDCGCGDGLLGSLVKEVISLDLRQSDTPLIDDIYIFDAVTFPYNEDMMPVFIRPCHSTFFVDSALREIQRAGRAKDCLYVSKPENLEVDIDIDEFCPEQVTNWVGADGERIYLIRFGGEPA